MAYHEAFWVVAGTGAPVIALAALVVLNQIIGLMARHKITGAEIPPDRHRSLVTCYWLIGAAVAIQIWVLTVALESLAAERDRFPLFAPGSAMIAGFLLLTVGGGLAIIYFSSHPPAKPQASADVPGPSDADL